MTFETVRYDKPLGKVSNLRDIAYMATAFGLGWLFGGFWIGVLSFLAVPFILVGSRLVLMTNAWHAGFAVAKRHMTKQGYTVDFEHDPRLMIDSKQRKVAVVTPAEGVYDLLDFNDILEWEHLWIDKSTPRKAMLNERVIGMTYTRENNRLVLKTRNPHTPRYEFPIGNYDTGQLWMARLGALLSGR